MGSTKELPGNMQLGAHDGATLFSIKSFDAVSRMTAITRFGADVQAQERAKNLCAEI